MIISINRYYGTNATNPSFRRMIAYSRQILTEDDPNALNLPIFVQYVASNQDGIESLRLKSHGYAKKPDRSYTATLPAVLIQIKVSLALNNNNDVIVSFFINSRNHDLSNLQLSTTLPSVMLNKFPYHR